MAMETVDALELEIRSKADDAARSIESLASSVSDFGKNVRRYVNNLTDFGNALKAIADAAKQLSQISGLGKVLDKVAPVAAALKAKTPAAAALTVRKDWKRQMFPNEADYNAAFQPKGFNRGKMPARIRKVASDSGFVMDEGDISKSGANAAAKEILKNLGQTNKTLSYKMMAESLRKIRAGSGRYEGANSAWMTPEALREVRDLSRLIVDNGQSRVDGDLLDRMTDNIPGGLIRISDEDLTRMKDAKMTMRDLRRELSEFGLTPSRTGGSGYDVFSEMLGLSSDTAPHGTVLDILAMLKGAKNGRNQAFIGEMGGTRETAMQRVAREIISSALDIGARNERTALDPDAVEAQKNFRKIFDDSQKAEPEVKQEAEQAAASIGEAVQERIRTGAQTATQELASPDSGSQRVADAPAYRAEVEAIKAEAVRREQENALETLRLALLDNTPELIAGRRSWAEAKGDPEGWYNVFGTGIHGLADRGFAAGLIDEDIAQAMKDAADGIHRVTEEAENASEPLEEMNDTLNDTADAMRETGNAAQDAAQSTITFRNVLSAAGKMLDKSLLGRLKNISIMRSLRYIVKSIAAGFKEGIGNLYGWSDAIGGHFAGAMDTLASKMMLVKNSVATAFAPAIEAIIPLISRVANWVNQASNAVAQFLALLTGSKTWTKALETTEKWADETKKKTGGVASGLKDANEEMKDLLADWDELNIIQSETGSSGSSGGCGGGGAGKVATDYSKMFEETSLFDKWTDYFDEIKVAVAAIGAGIAGWFTINKAADFLKQIGLAKEKVDSIKGTLLKGLTGAVLLTVAFVGSWATGKNIAMNGLTGGNIAQSVGNMLAAALGGKFLGGAIGKLIGGAVAGAKGGVIGIITGVSIALGLEIASYLIEKDKLAYDEAQDWLYKNGFTTFDVKAHINLVDATIGNARAARAALQESLTSLLNIGNTVTVGINQAASLQKFKEQIGDRETEGTLLYSISKYAEESSNVVRLFYEILPKKGENGEDLSAAAIKKDGSVWSDIEEWYKQKGTDLGNLLVENEKGEIEVKSEEVAMTLYNQITTAASTAERMLQEAKIQLAVDVELSKGAEEKLAKVYDDTKAEFEKLYENTYKEQILKAETEKAYLTGVLKADPTNSKIRKDLEIVEAELAQLTANGAMQEYVSSATAAAMAGVSDRITKYYVDEYLKPGNNEIIDSFVGQTFENDSEVATFFRNGIEETERQIAQKVFNSLPKYVRDWMDEQGISVGFDDLLTEDQKKKWANLTGRYNPLLRSEAQDAASEARRAAAEQSQQARDRYNAESTASAARDAMRQAETAAEIKAAVVEPVKEATMTIAEQAETLYGETARGAIEALLDNDWGSEFVQELVDRNGGIENYVYRWLDNRLGDQAGTVFDWLQSQDGFSSWFDPNQGVTIDTDASGAATDAAVQNVSGAINTESAAVQGLLGSLLTAMREVAQNTLAAANSRPAVAMPESALFGQHVARSAARWETVSGGAEPG